MESNPNKALTDTRFSDLKPAISEPVLKALAEGGNCYEVIIGKALRVTKRKAELAKLETIDCGKSLDEAVWDMDDVAGCFDYYADLAEGLDAKQKALVSLPLENLRVMYLRNPLGLLD